LPIRDRVSERLDSWSSHVSGPPSLIHTQSSLYLVVNGVVVTDTATSEIVTADIAIAEMVIADVQSSLSADRAVIADLRPVITDAAIADVVITDTVTSGLIADAVIAAR
jgi:adenine deaminase